MNKRIYPWRSHRHWKKLPKKKRRKRVKKMKRKRRR